MLCDANTPLITGTAVVGMPVPAIMNGLSLTVARITCDVPGGIGGSTAIQIRRRRAGSSASMLQNDILLGVSAYSIGNGVVDGVNYMVATDDILYPDVDSVTSVPPQGVYITLEFS